MFMPKLLLVLVASAAFGAVAHAASPVVTLDHPVEISTDCLIVPSSATGALTCGDRSFQLTADTVYRVGSRDLTFAQFGTYLRSQLGHVHNGAIVLTLDLKQVKRVFVADETPSAAAK